VCLAQPCDSGILRVRAKKPLRDQIPGLKQLASQHLQDGPHLNALRIVVQLAVADIVEAEHHQPVQHDEFVVRVHASDQLVALPVGKSFERLGVEVELDDLKVSAHEFPAIELHARRQVDGINDIQRKILGHCNRHALGVVVAGSMVGRHPTRTALILDRFDKADVSSIVAAVPEYRRSSAYPGQETSLFRMFQTSFELLDERDKNFFGHLAIFPEDTRIPLAAIELLGPMANT
jgi:hypothetical protein